MILFIKNVKNMKKKIFGGIAVLAIAAVAAWNVNLNSQKSDLSDVFLANVEALAQGESNGSNYKYVEPGAPGSGVACLCWQPGDLSCCG
ncbi:hypothetical protein AGMMS50239_24960 [Bacteroidia bacterium]|nr:hypothetical protein AGMMS50239_24960 [Bacteroidia bacterium]